MGVDPGASGGVAMVDDAGALVRADKMPETDRDVFQLLELAGGVGARAVLKRVWSSPQMGVASAFKFGVSVGLLRMALVASGAPFDELTPMKWQGPMGIRQATGRRPLGGPGQKDKNIAKRRAQELFPQARVTHAVADAMLLAEYCRRLRTGQIASPIVSNVVDATSVKTELF